VKNHGHWSFRMSLSNEMEVLKMKKWITGIVLVVVIILGSTALLTFAMNAARDKADGEVVTNPQSNNKPSTVNDIPVLKDPNMGVLTGENDSTLWVKSVSEQDYDEMMRILYPNGMLDEQGQEIGSVDDLEERRGEFIADHTNAFGFKGNDVAAVETYPFSINIKSVSKGEYSCLFYQARIEDDYFVYPSEWGGGQSCGFVTTDKAGIYLAYTDMGIWRIDPKILTSEKITSDTYEGKNWDEIEAKKRSVGYYLLWIDSVFVSPHGNYALYRTNKDCEDTSSDTTIWAIDLRTGKEQRIIEPALNNDIVGFVSDYHVMVGSLHDTRIVDITTGAIVSVSFPNLPNFRIDGVNDGIVVYASYVDGTSDTTAYISRIDASTGLMTLITKVVGYLGSETQFSPSGKIMAIGYGSDPMAGTDDVMLVDLATGIQKLLTASVENANLIDGLIRSYRWTCNDTLIITAQKESEFSTYVVSFGE